MANTGRPCEYTEEMGLEFCSRIALGRSLRSVVQDEDMPSHSAIYSWLGKFPSFAEQYARAKEDSGDADADKIEEVAEKVEAGKLDAQAARVIIDAYKWTAGKKRPRKYGERQQIEQTHRFEGMSEEELEQRRKALEAELKGE